MAEIETLIREEPAAAEIFADEIAELRNEVDDTPDAAPWLDWIWEAWWRLSDERPHIVTGMSAPMGGSLIRSVPGKISWSSVARWCDAHGYGDEDRDMMDRCIQSMDAVYLQWWTEKNAPKK